MNITIFMKNYWNFHRENFNLRFVNCIVLLLLSTMLWVSQSCQKDPSSIGLNIVGRIPLDAIFTDTTTLIAHSVLEDTLNTTNLIFNFLGYMKDPVFGTTSAGIYTQFVPSGSSISFGESPILDSIVLTLRYTGGFYGDTTHPFTIKVYELDEAMDAKKTYYQNSSLNNKGINLTYNSNFQLYPTPNTRVKLDTITAPHVRIRLDNELGERFLKNASQMATADAFKNFFKGLYICAEASRKNNGSLVNFTLTNALSGIQLYYRNDTIPKRQAFTINNVDVTRFSSYVHDYEYGKEDFKDQVLRESIVLGKKILYVQAMGGVKTKITFPHIKLLNNNIVVHKAELVITNIGDDLHLYLPPARLGLYGMTPAGVRVFLPDDDNATYFGGSYDATKKEYRFRITKYIQDVIRWNNFEPSIYLVAAGAAANANRLILNGTNPVEVDTRLRLDVYYTEY